MSDVPEEPAPQRDDPSPGRRRARRNRSGKRRLGGRLRAGALANLVWGGLVALVVVLACTFIVVFAQEPDQVPEPEGALTPDSAPEESAPEPEAEPTFYGPAGASDKSARRDKALRQLRKRAAAQNAEDAPPDPVDLRIATFNVLGTQHTAPGGTKKGRWPSGPARLPGAISTIKGHNVSVVGLQEVQPDQLRGIVGATGYAVYPGPDTPAPHRVNSVIYDPGVYELVSASTFQLDNGYRTRAQPILRLRHRESRNEFYVVNTHPPAGKGGMVGRRMATFDKLIGIVNDLKKDGIPVFLMGDMNDRERFFCRVLPATGMVASVGGTWSGGCRPPGRMPVDWIVATSDVSFSNYTLDESPIRRRISDHFFIAATARVGGAD